MPVTAPRLRQTRLVEREGPQILETGPSTGIHGVKPAWQNPVYSVIMPEEITQLLRRWGEGDMEAFHALTPLVYAELRRLAASHYGNERPGVALQPTELVHEAFLRLVDRPTGNWQSRNQFYAVASQVIRRVLIDQARARLRVKRGGSESTIALDDSMDFPIERSLQLTALDDALQVLAKLDARQAQVVELRFFAGLSIEDTAGVMGLSAATVKRSWNSARVWLLRELECGAGHDG